MQTRRKRDKRAALVLAANAKTMQNDGFDRVLRIVASAMALGLPRWKSVILLYRMLGDLVVDDTSEDIARRREIIEYIYSGKKPVQPRKAEAEHGKA